MKEKMMTQPKVHPEDGYWKNYKGEWVVVLHHKLSGVTPEMLDWWWDNIDINGYKLWDPKNHLSFKWVIDPRVNGRIGAEHKVWQKISGIPMRMVFRYVDPTGYSRTEGYPFIVVGEMVRSLIKATYILEWRGTDYGTEFKVTYYISGRIPEKFVIGVYNHDYLEQKRLVEFLPGLYNENLLFNS
jgi:hypothetical protein